jgi:AraC-like DNA-binding protein
MLKEKLYYEDNLPVSIRICEVGEYPIHFHADPEVVYLLKGELNLKNGYYTHGMKAGDVFIMNERELHSYVSEGGANLALILHFDVKYFAQYFPDLENSFLVTDTDDANDPDSEALRDSLLRIMMEFSIKRDGMEQRILEHAHTLIALLMDKFQFFAMENGRFVNISEHRNNKILAERMFRIQKFLYDNYNKRISLQEIAEREHLSIYYLSHVIRDATGLSFKEFLSFIRVEESERLLLGTEMKITHISDTVGFSAVRYYIKYFEKWYGLTPMEYREKYHDAALDVEVDCKIRDATDDEATLVIKNINNEIYREYAVTSDPGEEEIIVKLARGTAADEARHSEIREKFARMRRHARPAAMTYDLFDGLNYAVSASGDNFIASVKLVKTNAQRKSSKREVESAAILVFHDDDGAELKKLIKAEGLSGRYHVTIMRMTAENIEAAIHYSKRNKSECEPSGIRARIATYPEVRRSEIIAAGSLVFEVCLHGLGSELILFEPA